MILAAGPRVGRRGARIAKFCETVADAMAASGLSRCEALGCLAIIIAQEANAELDPPQALALADNVGLFAVNPAVTPEDYARLYAQWSFESEAAEKEVIDSR